MIRFPPAKINLGLNVIRKRPDGYHDLRSVMVPIPLHDVLEVITDHTLEKDEVSYQRTGLPIPGDPGSDLCMKALEIFRRYRPLPGLRVHLHKVIPLGAGLGGGSSDGANMLRLLNAMLAAQLDEQLPAMAAELGSDCSFFLGDGIRLIEGRGELTLPITRPNLKGQWLLLVVPAIHVSTSEVFRSFTPEGNEVDVTKVISSPIETWQGRIKNDLEGIVFKMHPELDGIKQELLRNGALYAAMSGSGSSVFGIFDRKPAKLEGFDRDRQWSLPL